MDIIEKIDRATNIVGELSGTLKSAKEEILKLRGISVQLENIIGIARDAAHEVLDTK